MFKDGVNLKKDAWYIKFMHFMWGATYEDFPNLCPLFWAVIGSIIIFPFWCLWKVIAFVFSLGGNLTWKQVKTPLSWIAEGIWLWVMSVFVTLLIVLALNSLLAKRRFLAWVSSVPYNGWYFHTCYYCRCICDNGTGSI